MDDIQKDAKEHTYGWYLQLPNDVELKARSGGDFILGELGEATGTSLRGSRRMLVRVLQADVAAGQLTGRVEAYVAHVDKRWPFTDFPIKR